MKIILSALLCFFFSIAFSQSNLLPGHVVRTSGDTLYGEINYRNWEKNPQLIEMEGKDGSIRQFYMTDLRSFTIDNYDRYEKAIVNRSTRPVEYNKLQLPFQDLTVTDTVMLRTIVQGSYSLYELVKEKTYYFLKDPQGTIEELLYRVELEDNSSNFIPYNIFRDQLRAKFNLPESGRVIDKLQHLQYRAKDLGAFVMKQNEQATGQENSWKPEQKKLIHLFAGTGVQATSLKIGGSDHELARLVNGKTSIGPIFQAGVDVFASRNLQRLFARAELGYSSFSTSGSEYEKWYLTYRSKEYNLKMQNVQLSIAVLYSLIKSESLDVYAGLAYGFYFTTYKQHDMVITYEDGRQPHVIDPYLRFEKNWGVMNGRLGARFKSHFEANLNYSFAGTFTNITELKIRTNMASLQVNYRF